MSNCGVVSDMCSTGWEQYKTCTICEYSHFIIFSQAEIKIDIKVLGRAVLECLL